MSLGTLTVDLSANTARLQSDLGKANRMFEKTAEGMRQQASKLGEVVGGLAAGLTAGAFAAWIKGSIDAADAMADNAESIGITVEALSGLSYAAQFAGEAHQVLNGALSTFNKNIDKAARGSEKQAQAFVDMGVALTDSAGNLKTTDQLLLDVADKFAGYEDGAQKAALAQELFGKSGAAMLPLLNMGAAGIAELTTQAERFGLVIDENTAKLAGQFNDNLDVMGNLVGGIGQRMSAELLPSMTDFTGLLVDLAQDSDAAATSADVLSGVLKGLSTVGLVISASFKTTGDAIGATAAALFAAAQGDFKGAWEIAKSGATDYVAATEAAISRIEKLWSGDYRQAGEQAAETAARVRQAVERTSMAHDGQADSIDKAARALEAQARAIDSQVEALQVQAATLGMTSSEATLYKLALDGATEAQLASARAALQAADAYALNQQQLEERKKLVDAIAEVEKSTWSEASRALGGYQEQVETLRKGLLDGEISQAHYDETMGGLEEQMAAAEEKNKATTTAISAAWEGAAKNIQGAMADFLFDPFAGGLDGMIKGFGTTIQRMVADAVAADLAERLFGAAVGGKGGGWLGQAASWAGSFFGGGRAIGGPVMAGKLYEVGEGNRSELLNMGGRQYLIPGNAGSITPGSAGAASNNNFTFNLPGITSAREARQARAELSRAVTGAVAQAQRYS